MNTRRPTLQQSVVQRLRQVKHAWLEYERRQRGLPGKYYDLAGYFAGGNQWDESWLKQLIIEYQEVWETDGTESGRWKVKIECNWSITKYLAIKAGKRISEHVVIAVVIDAIRKSFRFIN